MALLHDSFSDLWIVKEDEVGPGSGGGMEGFTTSALEAMWGQPELATGNSKARSLTHNLKRGSLFTATFRHMGKAL